MGKPIIKSWNEIKGGFKDTLILGNGASIAVCPRFEYDTLHKKAASLGLIDYKLQKIFDSLNSSDFEHVLYALSYSKKISACLDLRDGGIFEEKEDMVREALINAITAIHPQFDEICQFSDKVISYLESFNTIISLNYDLSLYWFIMIGNDPKIIESEIFEDGNVYGQLEQGNLFKDLLHPHPNTGYLSIFDDISMMREPHHTRKKAIFVFYPHGSLALVNELDRYGSDNIRKVVRDRDVKLLEKIIAEWRSKDVVPLVVLEGTAHDKLMKIQNNPYLSSAFNKGFSEIKDSVVFYGFSFSEKDDHILAKISEVLDHQDRNKINIAVSVHNLDENIEEINRIRTKLLIKLKINSQNIVFYSAEDADVWCY